MATTEHDNRPTFAEWQGSVPSSPREMLELVAREGVDRLVFRPAQVERADEPERSFNLAVKACDTGIKLGIALGSLRLDASADSFEVWLAQAIAAADLEGYAPKATPA